MFENDGLGTAGAGGTDGAVGSPPAPSPGVTGPPPDGRVGGSPPPGLDWNTAPQQFRDGHNKLQTEYQQTKQNLDRWNQIGDVDSVARSHQAYQGLVNEALQLAQHLGMQIGDVEPHFMNDPVGTVGALRQMVRDAQKTAQTAQAPQTQAELERWMDQRLQRHLQPFQLEREQRLDNDASNRFDGVFDRQFKTAFPNGLPDSNREALAGIAWQILLDDKPRFEALRRGDESVIPQAFEQAKATLLKVVNDYREHEKQRIATPPPQQAQPGKKPMSLDDMISNIGNPNVPQENWFRR